MPAASIALNSEIYDASTVSHDRTDSNRSEIVPVDLAQALNRRKSLETREQKELKFDPITSKTPERKTSPQASSHTESHFADTGSKLGLATYMNLISNVGSVSPSIDQPKPEPPKSNFEAQRREQFRTGLPIEPVSPQMQDDLQPQYQQRLLHFYEKQRLEQRPAAQYHYNMFNGQEEVAISNSLLDTLQANLREITDISRLQETRIKVLETELRAANQRDQHTRQLLQERENQSRHQLLALQDQVKGLKKKLVFQESTLKEFYSAKISKLEIQQYNHQLANEKLKKQLAKAKAVQEHAKKTFSTTVMKHLQTVSTMEQQMKTRLQEEAHLKGLVEALTQKNLASQKSISKVAEEVRKIF
ncbi:hypothetical protein EDD86DRAFT_249174 [Gorgonomyces haynaldii]|nr:hypothetical protein EDD86DRAFT_249174 [Gorgonomyces haynaldii]